MVVVRIKHGQEPEIETADRPRTKAIAESQRDSIIQPSVDALAATLGSGRKSPSTLTALNPFHCIVRCLDRVTEVDLIQASPMVGATPANHGLNDGTLLEFRSWMESSAAKPQSQGSSATGAEVLAAKERRELREPPLSFVFFAFFCGKASDRRCHPIRTWASA